jgi:hypothetical protein
MRPKQRPAPFHLLPKLADLLGEGLRRAAHLCKVMCQPTMQKQHEQVRSNSIDSLETWGIET